MFQLIKQVSWVMQFPILRNACLIQRDKPHNHTCKQKVRIQPLMAATSTSLTWTSTTYRKQNHKLQCKPSPSLGTFWTLWVVVLLGLFEQRQSEAAADACHEKKQERTIERHGGQRIPNQATEHRPPQTCRGGTWPSSSSTTACTVLLLPLSPPAIPDTTGTRRRWP